MTPFWRGFMKQADAGSGATGGGGFFGGVGKGNLGGSLERDTVEGTEGAYGSAGGEDTRTDKTLIDRDRGPRTEDITSMGPELQDPNIPHIRY